MSIRQISLVGFSQFETMTMESFFRLAGRRAPGYVVTQDTNAAHVWIVNGDTAGHVRALYDKQPAAEVILIGPEDHGTGWKVLPRPIRLLSVLDTIEQQLSDKQLVENLEVIQASLAARPVAQAEVEPESEPEPEEIGGPAPAAVAPPAAIAPQAAPALRAEPVERPRADFAATDIAPFSQMPLRDPFSSATGQPIDLPKAAPVPAPAYVQLQPPAPVPAARLPEPTPPKAHVPAPRGSGLMSFGNSEATSVAAPPSVATNKPAANDDDLILVVDDSDIVLRFMQGRLQRFGYAVELASTGEDAVQMTQARPYRFVFLDVMMPGIDGYQTCRMIKKQSHAGKPPPVIVMLSSRGGSIDKIRGTLAGASAYLTKPLVEAALIKVLADHDTETENNFTHTRPVSHLR